MKNPQHISNRLAQALPSAANRPANASSPEQQPESGATLSAQAIEFLFKVFHRRWSHKWQVSFDDDKARDLWLVDLSGLGVTDDMIRAGVHACAELEWPPSPAEFAKLCLPDDGLPGAQEALKAAAHGRYPHSVVYEAARRVGQWEMQHHSETQLRAEFLPVYERVCAEWRAGARFERQVAGLIEQAPKPPAGISDAEWNEYLRTLHGKSPAQHMAFAREALGRIPDPPRPAPKPVLPLNDDDVREQLRLEAEALAESQCIDRESLGLGSAQP